MKRWHLYFFWILLVLTPVKFALAQNIPFDANLYVKSSSANVRIAPNKSAPIAGVLPIGTKIVYKGFVDKNSLENRKQEGWTSVRNEMNGCNDFESVDEGKWICATLSELDVDCCGEYWSGWILADLLDQKEPSIENLILSVKQLSLEKLSERRTLAQRAFVLDPLNSDAQEIYFATLLDGGYSDELAQAKKLLTSYLDLEPKSWNTNEQIIFAENGGLIEPIAEIKSKQIKTFSYDSKLNNRYRRRGQFYNLYSAGFTIGKFVLEAQFDCVVRDCSTRMFGRVLNVQDFEHYTNGALALTYTLQPRKIKNKLIDQDQKKLLNDMALSMIQKAKVSANLRKTFLRKFKEKKLNQVYFELGQLNIDGKLLLIGNWIMGSVNDAHYSESPYLALMIIAEQQSNGSFQTAKGSGFYQNGCGYFDHADVDSDGVDEIVLYCAQLEGSYNYSFLKRNNDIWSSVLE